MHDFFAYTPAIRTALADFLSEMAQGTPAMVWRDDMFARISAYCQKGKAIRGNAILFVSQYEKHYTPEQIVPLACAMEIIHAALLMHDDIMDNDALRRGEPSMHTQYAKLFPNNVQSDAIGKSLALCVGDVCFFLAHTLVAQMQVPDTLKIRIIQKLSHELSLVALGQMQDLILPPGIQTTEEIILQTYLTKTARYTFSLPFALGGYCAGLAPETIDALELFGEHMGIIFQLQDDLLGLFGTEEEIGKPVGSDIREGKQTLALSFLLSRITPDEKKRIHLIMGNKQASLEQITYVRDLMHTYDIPTKINEVIAKEYAQAESAIEHLSIGEKQKTTLRAVLDYNTTRKK